MKKLARMLPCLLAVCLCLLCMAYTSAEESSTCDVHIAFCSAPTVCVNCGQSDVKIGIIEHNWDRDNYEYDEYFHWTHCLDCNIESSHNSHGGSCLTGVCNDCGATGLDSEILHEFDYENPQWDSDVHWSACIYCGKELEHNTHQISCTDGACVVCHQTGVNGDIKHDYDWYQVQHNDTHHWWICMYCDQEVDKREHRLPCTTGACIECGATDVNGEVRHQWGDFEYDDDECWRNCETCGEELWRQKHIGACNGDPSTCVNCGATGVNCTGGGHISDGTYYFDENQHWEICAWCGEQMGVYNHVLDCLTGTTCIFCGASGVNGEIDHCTDGPEHDENECWRICNMCGEEYWRQEHIAACNGDPNTCVNCGATGVNCRVDHAAPDVYYHDDDNHWQICVWCEENVWVNPHELDCVTGDTCIWCGASDVNGKVTHRWSDYYYDENECWQVCETCGEELWRQEHIGACTDPSTCVNCGATGVNCTGGGHISDGTYYFDENQHWEICMYCGEKTGVYNHVLDCLTGTTCIFCGASGVNGEINHCTDGPEHDENECWRICNMCGEEYWRQEHIAACNGDPNTCVNCGATGVNCKVGHSWYPTYFHDEDSHWYNCVWCGEPVRVENHVIDCQTGNCIYCDASGVNGEVFHNWGEYSYDDKFHWAFCQACGEESNHNSHWGSCLTGTCDCGATGLDPDILHQCDFEHYESDETNHWFVCDNCGEDFFVFEHEVDENGTCLQCGKTGLPTHEHVWVEKVVTPATCTEAGEKHIVCDECDEFQKSEEIPALGHTEKTVTTAATCTKDGSKVTRCETCGETLKTELIPANGHTEKTTETPATCTEDGSKVTTCETCGETLKTEPIPANGHTEKTTETPATCTEDGSVVITCEECGETLKNEKIPALGHTEKTTEIAATCTEGGSKVTTCETCGEVLKTETSYALEHAPKERVIDATCTEAGQKRTYCNRCGDLLNVEEIPALGHETRVKIVKRATCTSDGEAKVYCVRCNAVLETMTIPATGHQFTGEDATVCAVCNYVQGGEEVPSAAAPMVLPDDVAATAVATVAVADAPETIKVEVLEIAQTDYQKLALAADIAPVKVFALQLDIATSMEDMMDMTIPEKITLAVELTEEEAAELENMKMVIFLEDGSMQEITFEIEDGKLIFAIEQQGVFAFVPAEKVI